MKLENLPDYPALQQIGRALWKTGKVRGAAVLVGSGFSRNADLVDIDAPAPPLWPDIAAAMTARVYPGDETRALHDPLRIAEEFKAILGEPALESLIRELVRDDEWLPGELHKNLVRLPWTDILTTNWDTLLERAALSNLGQTYETVRSIGDIATTRAPRIVKLHGSLPSNRPFIVSEEDYRTYPRRFAPFVNLVQEVLLENELCLIGFSGDDPNFLQWSGWIRDQLGAAARRVFLISAQSLTLAERRLLESRHISPIDLSPLIVGCTDKYRYRRAAEIFIDYLVSSRPVPPWEWPHSKKAALAPQPMEATPKKLAESLRAAASSWETQRLNYPGWVVCPPRIRQRLESDTIHALNGFKSAIQELPEIDRGHITFEILWRLDKALIPVSDWIREPIEQLVLGDQYWRDQEHRYFVALTLLRVARENRNKAAFDRWHSFLETKAPSSREILAGMIYERCLWARDGLDFAGLKGLVEELNGPDSLWKLRRAGLHCDLGDGKTARALVAEGIREIRERLAHARDSISVLSRLAWAQFLSNGIRSWRTVKTEEPADESEALRLRIFERKADPWDSIRELEEQTEENLRRLLERSRTTEVLFDAGKYRDHRNLYFGSSPAIPIYQIARIGEVAGVPARSDQTSILGPRMQRAEALTEYVYEDEADYLRLLRVIEDGKEDFLERTFGRIQVARLSEDRVAFLRNTLNGALEYALEQLKRREGFFDQFWSQRTAAYTELLSRLAVRLDADAAKVLFVRSLSYVRDSRWKVRELFTPLAHLLERAFSAVPPRSRTGLLTEVISFPLPEEEGVAGPFERDWPESAEWILESLMSRPSPDSAFADRVAVLIEKTRRSVAETRIRAVLRLAHLFSAGVLTSEEADRFGEALWARLDPAGELPADTNLYSHMFLLLPSPDKAKARSMVMARDREPSSAEHLSSLSIAAGKRKDGTRALVLTTEEALKLLEGILAWRPKQERPNDLGDAQTENALSKSVIGAVLADAVFPALNTETLSAESIDHCFKLLEGGSVPSAALALPELLRIDPSLQDRVVKDLLRSVVHVDNDSAWAAFNALHRWTTLAKEGLISQVPRRLVESVVSIIEARREPGLLHALSISCQFLAAGLLTTDDLERLIAALEIVFIETSYNEPSCAEFRPTTFTLVRAQAIRLADTLRKSGRSDASILECLKNAERDPMPEVRFATFTSDE